MSSHALEAPARAIPERLRQALDQSGLFLEAGLARGGAPVGSDFKVNLLQLLLLLKSTPPGQLFEQAPPGREPAATRQGSGDFSGVPRLLAELPGHAESALARVQLHQLASLPTDDPPKQVWQFELPINRQEETDNFLLRIERDPDSGQAGETGQPWRVNLVFDLEPLGPVTARINLQEKRVTTRFVAERESSATRLEQALPSLDAALTGVGLEVLTLSASQGEAEEQDPTPPGIRSLVDEQA
ncbi:MAG: flagellar hook-length control protein FliK [gamma proteobacterium symbiont of Phacoides pectinatus]